MCGSGTTGCVHRLVTRDKAPNPNQHPGVPSTLTPRSLQLADIPSTLQVPNSLDGIVDPTSTNLTSRSHFVEWSVN